MHCSQNSRPLSGVAMGGVSRHPGARQTEGSFCHFVFKYTLCGPIFSKFFGLCRLLVQIMVWYKFQYGLCVNRTEDMSLYMCASNLLPGKS